MQSMNRKELEALVEKVRQVWLRTSRSCCDNTLSTAITDAIWEKMVPAAQSSKDGEVNTAWSIDSEYLAVRILICTDTPAPTVEADAVRLAQVMVALKCNADAHVFSAISQRDFMKDGCALASRILKQKEADDD